MVMLNMAATVELEEITRETEGDDMDITDEDNYVLERILRVFLDNPWLLYVI